MKNDSIDPVFSLWKTEDKAWLKQRRSEWEVLALDAFGETPQRDLALYRKFFLTGVKVKYISPNIAFLLCPFLSVDEARAVFYSTLFGSSEREDILSGFVFSVMPRARSMPWGRSCVRSFCEGVLGSEYDFVHSVDMQGVEIRAPDAEFFCQRYCSCSVRLMREGGGYYGYLECFDYFLSALALCVNPRKPKLFNIPLLLRSADDYLKSGDNDAVLDFAKKIQSASVEIDAIYQSWFS